MKEIVIEIRKCNKLVLNIIMMIKTHICNSMNECNVTLNDHKPMNEQTNIGDQLDAHLQLQNYSEIME